MSLFQKSRADCSASRKTVQTDADMRDTINHWRMKNTYKGKARELADAVSWFNQKNTKIQNCKVMDLRYEIKERMKESPPTRIDKISGTMGL